MEFGTLWLKNAKIFLLVKVRIIKKVTWAIHWRRNFIDVLKNYIMQHMVNIKILLLMLPSLTFTSKIAFITARLARIILTNLLLFKGILLKKLFNMAKIVLRWFLSTILLGGLCCNYIIYLIKVFNAQKEQVRNSI